MDEAWVAMYSSFVFQRKKISTGFAAPHGQDRDLAAGAVVF